MARLYANENFPFPVVEELRRRGHDGRGLGTRTGTGTGWSEPRVPLAKCGSGGGTGRTRIRSLGGTAVFEVDEASVIMSEKGRCFRAPKGGAGYDQPFATGWLRGIRECESERYLMNLHGTFYEKPREGGMWKIKPVASHRRQIMDFCTWWGLLVPGVSRQLLRPLGPRHG